MASLLLDSQTPTVEIVSAPKTKKLAIAAAACFAIASSTIFLLPVTTVDEFVVKSKPVRLSRNNDSTEYKGGVEISVPDNTEFIIDSGEYRTSDGVVQISGEVVIKVGTTVIYFED